ncbi:MAG: right-handed parallel beta-helix repeat-containing protein [Candidatus Micrarchaeota archaeon]|nr:right-handed parallel beta-helix repeat-containing protein [Candidatus Micrarchaeota archaeon]
MKRLFLSVALLFTVVFFLAATPAYAYTNCHFRTYGTHMLLRNDCITDETIYIPDGMTLDGRNHAITAVDPPGSHFRGAIIKNAGSVANVRNLKIFARNLANVCDAGSDRLRVILFEGASGSIIKNTIYGPNQGNSGCQEGNAIEVRNPPFDGTHPDTKHVFITRNTIRAYQKTGVVANGDVDVSILFNDIGSADLSYYIAANSIQLGYWAKGKVKYNSIKGNQWCGPSAYVATAVLMYLAEGDSVVAGNAITGNSDIGIYIYADNVDVKRNMVFDDWRIADCNSHGWDIGIGNYGFGNIVAKNMVFGFTESYEGPHISAQSIGHAPNKEIATPFI